MKTISIPVLGLAFLFSSPLRADDWPQLLGPQRNGLSKETGLNWEWTKKTPKTAWKVPLGSGLGSVAVVGDRIYALAQRAGKDGALCLDAKDGKELWHVDVAAPYVDRQGQGKGPRATPTYHNGKIYCQFAMGELVCLTDKGEKVWEKNILSETGAVNHYKEIYYWGVSFSPLVEGDLVIVQPGGTKKGSVAAFHKDTGKLVWSAGDDLIGYASPIAITVKGQRIIVCPTGSSILGLEPASGKVLFRYGFGNQFKATGATPVWHNETLFVSAAYGAGSAALEIIPGDKEWTVKEKWFNKRLLQNLMATSIVQDGVIYGCHGDLSAFFLRCLDLDTANLRWEQRTQGRHQFLGVEGKLLDWDERGNLALLTATPKGYTVEAELPKLLSFKSWAVPALANGRLYLRDERNLLCLDLSK